METLHLLRWSSEYIQRVMHFLVDCCIHYQAERVQKCVSCQTRITCPDCIYARIGDYGAYCSTVWQIWQIRVLQKEMPWTRFLVKLRCLATRKWWLSRWNSKNLKIPPMDVIHPILAVEFMKLPIYMILERESTWFLSGWDIHLCIIISVSHAMYKQEPACTTLIC